MRMGLELTESIDVYTLKKPGGRLPGGGSHCDAAHLIAGTTGVLMILHRSNMSLGVFGAPLRAPALEYP